MRNRTRVLFDYTTSAVYTNQNGSTSSTSAQNYGYKQIIDTVTPRFRRVVAKGGVKPYLPVEIITSSYTRSPASIFISRPGASEGGELFRSAGVINLGLLGVPSPDPAIISYVTNAAIAEAKAEAFDMLTFMAELGASARMISGRIHSLFNIADSTARLARRRSSNPRHAVQRFNELWLEARYGWRPIVYDIQNIVKQINDHKRIYQEGRVTQIVDVSDTRTSFYSGSANNVSSTAVRQGSVTYRGWALAVGSFGTRPQANPILTLHELISYSFVLDWLLDVGSWLAAVTPIPGVSIPASGYSIRTEIEETITDLGVAKPGSSWSVDSSTAGVIRSRIDKYQRFPSSVQPPRLYPRLTTLRLIDIVALIAQRAFRVSTILQRR